MSSSAVQVCDIFGTRMFRRKQRQITCVICKVWAPLRCSKTSNKDYLLIKGNDEKHFCQSNQNCSTLKE